MCLDEFEKLGVWRCLELRGVGTLEVFEVLRCLKSGGI